MMLQDITLKFGKIRQISKLSENFLLVAMETWKKLESITLSFKQLAILGNI